MPEVVHKGTTCESPFLCGSVHGVDFVHFLIAHVTPSILLIINCNHELFELAIHLVTGLATSNKSMRSILLDPMIGELGHEFKPLTKEINEYYCNYGNIFRADVQMTSKIGQKEKDYVDDDVMYKRMLD